MPRLPHDTLESVLEPLDGILGGDLVALADLALTPSPLRDTGTGAVPVVLVSQRSSLSKFSVLTCSSRSPFRRYQ